MVCQAVKSRCPEKKLLGLRSEVLLLACSHTWAPLSSRITVSPDDK